MANRPAFSWGRGVGDPLQALPGVRLLSSAGFVGLLEALPPRRHTLNLFHTSAHAAASSPSGGSFIPSTPSRFSNCQFHPAFTQALTPMTFGMMAFLAMWARRLSWRETARAFRVSWEAVFRSVEWTVAWGLKHRVLQGVRAIGVDEIHWGRGKLGDGFLTVIYQIAHFWTYRSVHCARRFLEAWCSARCAAASSP